MSHFAEAVTRQPSRLLEWEPYVLSEPGDPTKLRVTEGLGGVLASRSRVLADFFSPRASAAQEVRRHLEADACVAALRRMGVRVPAAGAVRAYLLAHDDLLETVAVIAERALARRARGDELVLELYRDPEARDEYLALYLRRHDYAEDTLRLIEEIAEETEGLLAGASGWVLVTTDFEPPLDV